MKIKIIYKNENVLEMDGIVNYNLEDGIIYLLRDKLYSRWEVFGKGNIEKVEEI